LIYQGFFFLSILFLLADLEEIHPVGGIWKQALKK